MTTARSQPFVPLEDFLETVPEDGVRLEWCAGTAGGTIEIHGKAVSIDALYG